MSRTQGQINAAALQENLFRIASKCDNYTPQRALALGRRLVDIMSFERSPEFMEKLSTVTDTFTGKRDGEKAEDLIKELVHCAKHLESTKHGQAANFCRAMSTVLSAFIEKDINRAAMPLSRAGVKAWYAGGNKEAIIAAYMLLF